MRCCLQSVDGTCSECGTESDYTELAFSLSHVAFPFLNLLLAFSNWSTLPPAGRAGAGVPFESLNL